MCYSARASAVAYCIGLLVSFVMFRLGHPVIGTLMGTISGMQLAEGVVWHSIDTDSTPLNQVGTRMIHWNLSTHALMTSTSAIYFCMWCAHGGKRSTSEKTTLFVLWAIAFMLMLVMISTTRTDAETHPGCTPNIRRSELPPHDSTMTDNADQEGWWSRHLAQPFACRLAWDTSSVPALASSGLYAAQVAVILLVMSLVYREKPVVVWVLLAYVGLMLLGLGGAAWMHTRSKDPDTRKRAVVMAMSTVWCFGVAVLSPALAGVVWWFGL